MRLSRIASIALPAAAIAAVSVPLAVSANAAPGTVSRPSAAAPKVAVYDCTNRPLVRPREFIVFCDSSRYLTKLSWTSWNATEATGTGLDYVDNCVPNCAQGKWSHQDAIVVLWRTRPVPHHKGQSAYTKMTLLYPGSGRTETMTPPGMF
ncbi:MAG: hypothetical protein JO345_36595 [Streptosporangiaceae bacterium]|nr:hypothetical protein [Streptosporangiaceae bacterium]